MFARHCVEVDASPGIIFVVLQVLVRWPAATWDYRQDTEESGMAATVLMLASAAILLTMGTLHLIYTFCGPKLTPRDPALQRSMGEVSPVITNETNMWRCWVGFNASHSMAAMLYGLIYGFLAIAHPTLLFSSSYLLVVGLLMVGGFVALAKVYWFNIPFLGTSISLACYVASIIASLGGVARWS